MSLSFTRILGDARKPGQPVYHAQLHLGPHPYVRTGFERSPSGWRYIGKWLIASYRRII